MSQINIGNLTIDKFCLGDSSDVKICLGDTLLYPQSQPQPSVRYAVTDDISTYQDTTYLDVYNMSDDSWYKRNNLNEYEEYGVYGESTASTETYYNGKLALDNGYEYKYANNQWNNLGEASLEVVPFTTGFSSSQVLETIRLDISGTTSSVRIYLSKTPDSTSTFINWYINMQGTNSQIYYTTSGTNRVSKKVTACTLVSGTTYEFTFPYPMYFNAAYHYSSRDIKGMPLVASAYSQSFVEEYVDVPQPDFYNVYGTVAEMEDETDLYYGKYGQVGNVIYKYATTNEWVTTADKIMTGTTVSNIRSSTIGVTGGTNNIEKIYVNRTSVNGVYNWFFHNEESLSQISFNSSSYNTDNGIASFDWNTLDVSNMITASTFLINGSFSYLREVDIPPYLTNINSSYINKTSKCPIRINVLGNEDIQLGESGYFFSSYNTELYLPNGNSITGIKSTDCPRRNDDYLKVYVPSSAISKYKENEMKYFIPFMELLDDGEADLSYSYYINSPSNTNPIIDLTATTLDNSWTSNTNTYADYVLIGKNLRTVGANAFRDYATISASIRMRISRLKFSNGVTSIGDHAFAKESLNPYSQLNVEYNGTCLDTSVYILEIPDSVETISNGAFVKYKTGNYKIIIGSGCKDIGTQAFLNYTTTSPKGIVICKAVTPPTLHPVNGSYQSVFFRGVDTIDGIYVPDESVDAYKTATGWSEYASVIKSINDYVE